MISPEQTEQIKTQIINQLESSDLQNKEQFKEQIKSMNGKQLEEFLKQQQYLEGNKTEGQQQCIFCSIAVGKTSSYKIEETHTSLAVLEINPISRGHIIIIPKKHAEKIPKESFNLAEKISKKLSQLFQPKEIEIIESSLFGHGIINVFPVYKNESLHSHRQQATPEDLKKLQEEILNSKQTPNNEKSKERKLPKLTKPKKRIYTDKNTWLPRRIP